MISVEEIEDAIRALPVKERVRLAEHLPSIVPELNGDAEWERLINDSRPRPELNALAAAAKSEFRARPGGFRDLSDDNLK